MSQESVSSQRTLAGLAANPRLRRWAIGIAVAYALYAIGLGLIAPWAAHEPIEDSVGELLGVDVSIEHVSVNPFTLRVELAGIEVRELDGGLLLAAKSLVANIELLLSITGVARVDSFVLDTPEIHAELSADGDLNLLALLPEGDDEPEDEEPSGLFPVRADVIQLIDGSVRFVDHSQDHLFVTSIKPIDLSVYEISTVPDEVGLVRLEAVSSRGIRLVSEFSAAIEPLMAEGQLSLEGLRYNTIADYLGPRFPVRPTAGEVDIHTDFKVSMDVESGLVVAIDEGGIEARDWEAESDLAELRRVGLHRFAIEGFRLGLSDREVGIAQIVLEGPHLAAVIPGPDTGTGNATEQAESPEPPAVDDSPTGDPVESEGAPADLAANAELSPVNAPEWTIEIDRFAVADGQVSIASHVDRDEVLVSIGPVDLEMSGISSKRGEDIEVSLTIGLPDGPASGDEDGDEDEGNDEGEAARTSRDGSRIAAEGRIVPRPASAKLDIKAIEVALAPWSPLVGFAPGTRLSSGRLDMTASLEASMPEGAESPTASVSADLNLRDLVLEQTRGSRTRPVVKLGRMLVERIRLKNAGRSLGVTNVRVDSPEIHLERDAKGVLNLTELMAPTPSSAAGSNDTHTEPMAFDLRRIEVADGRLHYRDATTDRSVKLEFTDIAGEIERRGKGAQGSPGTIDFTARAHGSAPLSIQGGFPAEDEIDIKVVLEGLAVVTLAPYFEQYVGSEVEQGKLHADLDYSLKGRQIAGENDLRFDRLVFGQRTGSKDALKLPIPLAFKLLTDTKGQTVLDLPPIKGDLDDPNFSLRSLVVSAFMKVIQQSLTSPLAVLQTAMPDFTADQRTQVDFATGSAELGATQREKLMNIATVVASKKGDRVAIKSRVDKRRDKRALRDAGQPHGDEELLGLGTARAKAVRTEFIDQLGLDPDRIFIRSVDLDGEAHDDRIAIDVLLTDD